MVLALLGGISGIKGMRAAHNVLVPEGRRAVEKGKLSFHQGMYAFCRPIAKALLRKYDFATDMVPALDEPFLMVANHTTESDMMMAMVASRQHVYFVCGEHLMRGTYGPLIKRLFDPIALPKGGSTLHAVKEMMVRLKAGCNVMIFPEGSRSFHGETLPADDAIGKLVLKSKCALVTYRIHGGYFIAPRWAYAFRKGKAWAQVTGAYSSEQLAGMSAAQVTELINQGIYENAHAVQREARYAYRGRRLAEGLENYLVICPECGGYDTMESRGDEFRCTACGTGGRYGEDGFLHGEGLRFDNVLDWGRWMEGRFGEDMDARAADDPNALLFRETDVKLYEIADGATADVAQGELEVYFDRLVMGDQEFRFRDISALSMLYFGKTLLFTCKGRYLGMTGEHFHAWKCNQLYERAKG